MFYATKDFTWCLNFNAVKFKEGQECNLDGFSDDVVSRMEKFGYITDKEPNEDISKMTKIELQEVAKEIGVEDYSTFNKAELLKAIEEKQSLE